MTGTELCFHSIEELAPKLQLLGEVFGAALHRRDSEINLQKSFDEIDALKDRLDPLIARHVPPVLLEFFAR